MHMKKPVASLILILAASCCLRDVAVFHDSDPAFQYGLYSTYRWEPVDPVERSRNPLYYNELNDERITTAANEVLAKKGYLPDSVSPDLTIHYHIVVNDKTIFLPHELPARARNAETGGSTYEYLEGTLKLDFMDAHTEKLMWRGWAVGELENIGNSDDLTNLFRSLVENILVAFPSLATKENAEVK